MRLTKQTLEDLEAGIRERVEKEIRTEEIQRSQAEIQARKWLFRETPSVIPASMLQVGDVLVNCSSGCSFYEDGVVTYVGETTPDGRRSARDLWVEIAHHQGGRSGHSFVYGEPVLVKT